MPPNSNNRVSPEPVRVVDSTSVPTTNQEEELNNNMSNNKRSRSVNDFDTDTSLLEALLNNGKRTHYTDSSNTTALNWQKPPPPSTLIEEEITGARTQENTNSFSPKRDWDWVVSPDPNTSYPQTLENELNRLKVLRSYDLLDNERKACFERLTGLGSRMFHVPMCLVTLIDLGRQWFVSNRGVGDLRETPRKFAFCAHTILSTEDLMIVNDASQDVRFHDNPFVKDPPNVRFYAGAPLISPEGYKLGTLCIIDVVPRPDGLNLEEKQNLRELAALVVDSMVQHKKSRQAATKRNSTQIACTAHDMLTPLNGVQLSLNLLQQEKESMHPSLVELLDTASTCCDVMSRTCQQAITAFRQHDMSNSTSQEKPASGDNSHASSSSLSSITDGSDTNIVVADLVKNLEMVMEHYPKSVPISISVDPSVPPVIVSDDLKVFRAALNYLTNACSKTTRGSVALKISTTRDACLSRQVLFECIDTGPGVKVELYSQLFQPIRSKVPSDVVVEQEEDDYDAAMACIKHDPKTSKWTARGGVCTPLAKHSGLGLFSVATNIARLKGDYGYRPQQGNDSSGAIFWFSVPLVVPLEKKPEKKKRFLETTADSEPIIKNSQQWTTSAVSNKKKAAVKTSLNGVKLSQEDLEREDDSPRIRRALVIDDSIVIRKSVSRALTKLGLVVSQAVNGMEGFKLLQLNVFDFVLCDFLMPVMDGLDCMQQYRQWEQVHRPWFKQYVVGISAHASPKDIERGKNAGMNDFIAKPVTFRALKELEASPQVNAIKKELDEMLNTPNHPYRSLSFQPSLGRASRNYSNRSLEDKTLEEQVGRVINRKRKHAESMTSAARGRAQGAPGPDEFVCLIAESSPVVAEFLSRSIEQFDKSWKTVVVHDGQDALRLLKIRQYDAVFVNEEVPTLDATRCVERFREWEQLHRVSRQNRVVLLSNNFIPTDGDSTTTMICPNGFDGALGKPICLTDLHKILRDASQNVGKYDVITR